MLLLSRTTLAEKHPSSWSVTFLISETNVMGEHLELHSCQINLTQTYKAQILWKDNCGQYIHLNTHTHKYQHPLTHQTYHTSWQKFYTDKQRKCDITKIVENTPVFLMIPVMLLFICLPVHKQEKVLGFWSSVQCWGGHSKHKLHSQSTDTVGQVHGRSFKTCLFVCVVFLFSFGGGGVR